MAARAERPRPRSGLADAGIGRAVPTRVVPDRAVRGRLVRTWAIPAALLGIGLLVRLPHLWTIPSLTDEAYEVLRGLDVAQGRLLPLTNVAIYLGSGYNYLLAAVFLVVGPDAFVPRALVALAGALTVPATYLLLGELGLGRGLALVGSGLLATSGAHVMVSSHVAWSHSLTPLVATLGLWLLARAVRRGSGRLLPAVGLVLGLAVQTHTTALALLPGAALYALIGRPGWLRTPWPYLAGLAFLLPNANLVAFNVLTDGGSIADARTAAAAYTRTRASGLDLYLENLGKLCTTLARVVAGAVDVREHGGSYLRDPAVWPALALLLVGLVRGALRGPALPALVLVPYVLVFPLANPKWEVIPNARFLAPLLPLAYAAVALGLGATLAVAGQWASPAARRWAWPAIGIALALAPLAPLARRYEQMADSAATSTMLLEAVADLEARRQPDEWVALDPDLDKLWLDGGGDYLAAFEYLLRLRSIPVRELEFRRQSERGDVNSCQPNRVELRWVMPERAPNAARLFADDPATPEDESRRPYWQIRTVQRSDRARDAQLGQADEWRLEIVSYTPPVFGSSRAVDRCAPGRPI